MLIKILTCCFLAAMIFNFPGMIFGWTDTAKIAVDFSSEDHSFLDKVQKHSFRYFTECINPENGLVMDKAPNHDVGSQTIDFQYSAASIAGVGFALTVFPVGVERGWISRERALELTRTVLQYFLEKMDHKNGFFYHFTDMHTGKRAMNCEVSSIDTAIFLAGALFAAQYFTEEDISALALKLYSRTDWQWMCNGARFPSMGWTPESGFIPASWDHYSEGLLLYILAMGSPTHSLPAEAWNFRRIWGRYRNHVFLINQPLFTHQFPQVWLDLRNKRDAFANYFESSVQATLANRQFCLDLRPSFKTFSDYRWGLTACIGPNEYQAYGAPPNQAIVDGTVAPAAAACSIVFTPAHSLSALKEYYENHEYVGRNGSNLVGRFGLSDSFNLDCDYVASEVFAINQGPMILMIENARSEFIWKHFMKIPFVIDGMKKAGFMTDYSTGNLPANAEIYETAAYIPHLRPVYECVRVADTFSLDNATFEETIWNTAAPMLLDEGLLQTIIKPPARMDFNILWRMLHNTESLFLRFEVHDRDVYSSHSDGEMYLDDCIEIYINTGNMPFRWGGPDDCQIVLSPAAGGGALRVREFQKGEKKTESLKWKFEPIHEGYRVILEIPRKEFGLGDISVFAASIAAHDVNSTGEVDVKYNWFFPLPSMILPEIRLVKKQ